ncbi:LuxR family transcriptional regulator [Donghicola sp. C2-DW-16]|uniref:LuxR family transcriptional regulator n=1 Tax=Donghicola mangrovi TaxID=2729614 RepID=A0ABX2PGI0_9RHOB|nr:LuxR family transcriptional regulator [Donghicola mangrovi]NVO27887.1 LuxR family transcriptional regulator [Donghicola mangrovi]
MSLSSYLEAITDSQSLEALWSLHSERMAEYGFDRLIYGLTHYRSGFSLGDPNDFLIMTTHKPEYIEPFINDGHYFHAPMVKWALEHEGACSWSTMIKMVESGTLTPAEMRVVEFNRRMGVTAGYTISFKAVTQRSKGAIALTAREGMTQDAVDAVWDEHGRDIILANNVAHLKISSLPYTPPTRSLTKRQREALQWVGDGKTTQDIAILMGLTAATVEKHLRLARESLNVETTAQAVLKAAFQNQMFIVER